MATENKALYSPISKTDSDSIRVGDIVISSDVIADIAAQAARKVDGVEVVDSSFKLSEIFGGKETVRKGVAVRLGESGHVEINADVNVRYGVTIYEAVRDFQNLIKEEVEALTGTMIVDHVNVRVRRLIMPEQPTEREVMTPDQALLGEEPLEDLGESR